MDDKENNRDADAGVRHVESRPRMRERHVQVKQEKINHVAVKETVGQIPENAGQQQGQ